MSDLDPVIHAPVRLRLCALLSAVDQAEFVTLRRQLDVADSVLSKHVATLAESGYVAVSKGSHDGRRTTWIGLTRGGRQALAAHLAALRALIDAAVPDAGEGPSARPDGSGRTPEQAGHGAGPGARA